MKLDDYQVWTRETRQYSDDYKVVYPALGLAGEAGEVADQVKKVLRNDGGRVTDERRAKILDECGDVLYYLAATCDDLQCSLSDVARANQKKLLDRKARDQIKGDGGNR